MSRTDAHRPVRVWLLDHPELVLETHDHRVTACDLPESVHAQTHGPATRCRRELHPIAITCHCDLCSATVSRRRDRRTVRTRERLLCRAAARGAGLEDLERMEGWLRSVRLR